MDKNREKSLIPTFLFAKILPMGFSYKFTELTLYLHLVTQFTFRIRPNGRIKYILGDAHNRG